MHHPYLAKARGDVRKRIRSVIAWPDSLLAFLIFSTFGQECIITRKGNPADATE
jgi:hypothetical protein